MEKSMKLTQSIAMAIVLASGSVAMAGAVVELGPSDISPTLTGLDNVIFPEIRGATLQDVRHDFSIYADTEGQNADLLYQGTLMTRVVRSHATGNLTFNYVLVDSNDSLSGSIAHVEVSGFEGWQTRVEYRNDAHAPYQGDAGPTSAQRNASGDIIDFNFGSGLASGDQSEFFFAMLDTTEFYQDTGLATVYLDSGESVSFSVISANPVPAPGALGLLSAAGLLTVRRRR